MRYCAWCGKVLGPSQEGLVTHGICKGCEQQYFNEDEYTPARTGTSPVRPIRLTQAAVRSEHA